MPFSKLGLLEVMQRVVEAADYREPTPIQQQTIPLILEGMDLIAQAQTGTGKTAAFALPLLQRLHAIETSPPPCAPRVLVLAPTRELAQQVAETFNEFGKHMPRRIGVATVIGGAEISEQLRDLEEGVDIVVATPGRLLELVREKDLFFYELLCLVIDEADRLLALGFAEELEQVFEALPAERQSLLFSATYPKKVVKLTEQVMRNPSYINVIGDVPTVGNITQRVIEVDRVNRRPLLQHLIKEEAWKHVLIFVSSKRAAHNLAAKLRRNGIQADAFHGDLTQEERTGVLSEFKNHNVHVLVATDIAARGIDIQELSTVVNYDLPRSPVDYIHRIGRTGRAGAKGVAISFVDHNDQAHFNVIEKRTRVSVDREQVAGFERTGEAPEKKKGPPPKKGKRPSKKDKARAAAREHDAAGNDSSSSE
ncbi:DEAD/DEAH box helicase [Pontiella sulfatireligans]|uniref:ATP-dependent RNA helicase RhlE n=1 Tax=Pontiella sulfatireligans TaxID=2750658 RepID=A0A6C2ULN7_9BACT|nr:DEAD/DEAH box helicase [Pontiella sulfatireligans]VGO21172.1 ATP-dependent RNA helicase RhlE [Pontiella sulfatireligans]